MDFNKGSKKHNNSQMLQDVIKITKDIKAGEIAPVYFLMGEEPYYIDKLTHFIENNILTEDEKGFNQVVLYGRDATVEDIVSSAKRYPMMAERQVVVVREAQDLARTIDKLETYIENPQPTTVLVFAYKYKTLDKRKKITKLLSKNAVLFESKKMYDNQVGDWIVSLLKSNNYGIQPKAAAMLVEFLGADLSKIANELDKLKIILPQGHVISPDDIERNIGISKDYNVFEFRNALGERNTTKATQIAKYFAENPKENPMVVITSQVYAFYVQLLRYHGLQNKSKQNVASLLRINPYFVKDVELAARNYPMRKVSAIIAALREIDVKSKGVGATGFVTSYDLLKDMLVVIFSK